MVGGVTMVSGLLRTESRRAETCVRTRRQLFVGFQGEIRI